MTLTMESSKKDTIKGKGRIALSKLQVLFEVIFKLYIYTQI